MKSAKLLLASIAILGIVGGAIAFKANRTGSLLYIDDPVGQQCTKLVLTPYVADPNGATVIHASTTTTKDWCGPLKVRADA